jgi:hypothetical protein
MRFGPGSTGKNGAETAPTAQGELDRRCGAGWPALFQTPTAQRRAPELAASVPPTATTPRTRRAHGACAVARLGRTSQAARRRALVPSAGADTRLTPEVLVHARKGTVRANRGAPHDRWLGWSIHAGHQLQVTGAHRVAENRRFVVWMSSPIVVGPKICRISRPRADWHSASASFDDLVGQKTAIK